MPARIQIDESFAFLFTCIEVSGCKIDFKLVGDALDLQPAAARMRYSRLRKTVESGQFKDLSVVQPVPATEASVHLAAMANPDSQRLADASRGAQDSAQIQSSSQDVSNPLMYEPQAPLYIGENVENDGVDDEEEENVDDVASGFEDAGYPNTDTIVSKRKRKASLCLSDEENQGLFFPDDTEATRKAKHSRSDDTDEEYEGTEDADTSDDDSDWNPVKHNHCAAPHSRARARHARRSPGAAPALQTSDDATAVRRLNVIRDQSTRPLPQQKNIRLVPSYNGARRTFQGHPQLPAMYPYATPGSDMQTPTFQQGRPSVRHSIERSSPIGVVSGQTEPTQEDISYAQATGLSPMIHITRVRQIHGQHTNQRLARNNSPIFSLSAQRTPQFSYPQSPLLPRHLVPQSKHSNFATQQPQGMNQRASPLIADSEPTLPVLSNNLKPRRPQFMRDVDQFQSTPVENGHRSPTLHPVSVFHNFRPPITDRYTPFGTTNASNVVEMSKSALAYAPLRRLASPLDVVSNDTNNNNIDPRLRLAGLPLSTRSPSIDHARPPSRLRTQTQTPPQPSQIIDLTQNIVGENAIARDHGPRAQERSISAAVVAEAEVEAARTLRGMARQSSPLHRRNISNTSVPSQQEPEKGDESSAMQEASTAKDDENDTIVVRASTDA